MMMMAEAETDIELILTKWHFPQQLVDKYKSLGIVNIFAWQAECLSIPLVNGMCVNLHVIRFEESGNK